MEVRSAFWSQYPLNFELIEKILEKGGRVRSDFVETATSKERVDLLKVLLEYGSRHRYGWDENDRKNALDTAGKTGEKEIILMVEEHARKVEGWVKKQNLSEQKEVKRKQKKWWQFRK
jgi:hypothetical protein